MKNQLAINLPVAISLLLCAFSGLTSSGQPDTTSLSASLVAKLSASDGATNDYFGVQVSISGDTAAVAAQGANGYAGAVYLFERNAGGPDRWGQVKIITASDAQPFAYFIEPALSGDTLIVGAGGVSKAYVFERNAGGPGNWGLVKILRPNWGGDGGGFGFSAIDRDTIVVGASLAITGGGAAFVFERNAGGPGNWGLVKELAAPNPKPGDYFFTPAVSGDTIVIGAQGRNSHTGAAFVFERNAGGPENWGLIRELTASDAGTNDGFGVRVSLSGDTLAVGAPNNSFYTTYSGAAYVFERNAGGSENWGQVKKLTATNPITGGDFGIGLSLAGDTLAAGGYQGVYLFGRDSGGAQAWGQISHIPATNSTGQFGTTISLSGNTLLAADYFEDSGKGAVYVYLLSTNSPPQTICQSVTKAASANCDATVAAAEIDHGSKASDGGPLALSLNPPGPYPIGTTIVTLTATDSRGASSSCNATVTVLDVQPPEVTCSVRQTVLWPPNHQLENVGLNASATDNCSPGLAEHISVFTNEKDETASGASAASLDSAGTLRLGAQRRGDSQGRVYLVVVQAADGAGNVGLNCCTVVVPHNAATAAASAVKAQASAAQSYCLSHGGSPPAGYSLVAEGAKP